MIDNKYDITLLGCQVSMPRDLYDSASETFWGSVCRCGHGELEVDRYIFHVISSSDFFLVLASGFLDSSRHGSRVRGVWR